MRQCRHCGAENSDSAKFCRKCGMAFKSEDIKPKTQDYDPVVDCIDDSNQNPVEYNEEDTSEPFDIAPQIDTAPRPPENAVLGKLYLTRDKVVGFENNRHLVINVIVMCCALIVALIALFAPIKVVAYYYTGGESDLGLYYISSDEETQEAELSFCEVDQSIWQIMSALSYIEAGTKKKNEIKKQADTAFRTAELRYNIWAAANTYKTDDDKRCKRNELIAEELSKINYLGYIIVLEDQNGQNDMNDGEHWVFPTESSQAKEPTSDYNSAVLTAAFGCVIALIAIAVAITSVVSIIMAIVGILNKKTKMGIFKYLGIVLGMSFAAVALMFCAPMLIAGGGMYAVTMFGSVVYLLCAIVFALAFEKKTIQEVVKSSVLAVLCMISFYLLCTDVFVAEVTKKEYATFTNVPTGFGLASLYEFGELTQNGMTPYALKALTIGADMLSFFLYIFIACFAEVFVYKALLRNLKSMSNTLKRAKSSNGFMIVAMVMMAIAIFLGMSSPSLITGFGDVWFDSDITLADAANAIDASVAIYARVPLLLSFVSIIGAIIFGYVYKPAKNKDK